MNAFEVFPSVHFDSEAGLLRDVRLPRVSITVRKSCGDFFVTNNSF